MSKQYESLSKPPENALKPIKGGRLNGKTDINPQWRYEALDKEFGLCGFGWTYEIVRLWESKCDDGQIMCFSEVKVYIHTDGEWSRPIPGIGGSMLISKETGGLHASDEGYKMATTDALSVALKMIGVGADIYRGNFDGTKYKDSGIGRSSEAQDLAVKLEEWLTVQPPMFSDENARKVRSCIAANDVENMKKWLAWAAKRNAEA